MRVLKKLQSLWNRSPGAAEGPKADPSVVAPPTSYRPGSVRLFIKPYCPWCRQAMDWLDDHAIPHTVLDVIRDSAAYEEMFRLSRQTLAPVIDVDGQVLADFGARELAEFWRRLERAPSQPRP
jgi:glutaredoxin